MSWPLIRRTQTPVYLEQEGNHADERLGLLASHHKCDLQAVEMKTLDEARLNSSNGIYPIHNLVEKGVSLDLLRRQIEGNPDSVHIITKNGWTPLHFACWRGRLDFVQLLVEKGNADVTARDEFNWTPFHCAVENAHVEICSYLLRSCGEQLQEIMKNLNTLSPNVQKMMEQLQQRMP